MLDTSSPSCVVVGIDGSQSALDAALWAIDEALALGLSLRLVNVIESSESPTSDHREQPHPMAAAELAVHRALDAVESAGRPVAVEAEILRGRPVQALLDAARSAAMLCVGARGLKHATQGRIGSTAAALSAAARCPVVIVRMHRAHGSNGRAVVIEVGDTAGADAALQHGVDAARRRGAPARVLTPSLHADVRSRWQRRLAEWQRRFPDVEITSVRAQGDGLDYIRAHAGEIQLVVVSRDRREGIGELVGAAGNAALRDTDCSIMVYEPPDSL